MQYHEACGMHRVHDTDTWHSVLCAIYDYGISYGKLKGHLASPRLEILSNKVD